MAMVTRTSPICPNSFIPCPCHFHLAIGRKLTGKYSFLWRESVYSINKISYNFPDPIECGSEGVAAFTMPESWSTARSSRKWLSTVVRANSAPNSFWHGSNDTLDAITAT
jgi:hypothetical protein